MSRMWMSIEPKTWETQVMLTKAEVGTLMRARFPLVPVRPEGLGLFLQGVAAWHGEPFCAVLDVDSAEVYKHPERWARLIGDLDDAYVKVQWTSYTARLKDDPLNGTVGDFRRARRLLSHAATGLK